MRALAVSYMLPPMLYPQAIQIGRLLSYLPGEVAAVSGRGEGAGGLDCYADLDRKLAFRIDVPFAHSLPSLPLALARRFAPLYGRIPDEYRAWVPRAETVILDKLEMSGFRPDVLITFGEPMSDHLLGERLKRRLNIPWVAHFSDPWADNPFRRGNPLANIVNRKLERATVAAADRVIFTSPETADLVMTKYPASWRAKSTILPHSFDLGLYPQERGAGNDLIVRHLGNFYGRRTPYPLFRALRILADRNPAALKGVRVELIGRAPTAMRWHPAHRALPEDIIKIRGTVPYRESLRLMRSADLLLVMDAPDDLSVFLPSKLVDYLGSGTPIMGIVPPGTSKALLTRLGGITADPRAPDEVASALQNAITAARLWRETESSRPWGDRAVRTEFEPERNALVLQDILRSVLPMAALNSGA